MRDEEFPDVSSLDFVEWEKVLTWNVDETSLAKVSVEEFCFLALYDMTFDGFERETREQKLDGLLKRMDPAQ